MSANSTLLANLAVESVDGLAPNAGQVMLNRMFPQYSFPANNQVYYSGYQYVATATSGSPLVLFNGVAAAAFVIRNAGTNGFLGIRIKGGFSTNAFVGAPTLSPGGIFAVFNQAGGGWSQNSNAAIGSVEIFQDGNGSPVTYEYLYAY